MTMTFHEGALEKAAFDRIIERFFPTEQWDFQRWEPLQRLQAGWPTTGGAITSMGTQVTEPLKLYAEGDARSLRVGD
jgi:hypothetical protein